MAYSGGPLQGKQARLYKLLIKRQGATASFSLGLT
jgi:hypothetical protein